MSLQLLTKNGGSLIKAGQRAALVPPRVTRTAPVAFSRALTSSSRGGRKIDGGAAGVATTSRRETAKHFQAVSTVSFNEPSTFIPQPPRSVHARSFATQERIALKEAEAYTIVRDGTESYLVAGRPLHKGEVLFDHVGGEVLRSPTRHSVQVTETVHLNCSGDLPLINHGCDPNCRMEVFPASGGQEPYLRITVISPVIEEGTMLMINYNAFEVDMSSPFECHCGAPNCHGRIEGFSKLSIPSREQYLGGDEKRSSLLTEFVHSWATANRDTPPPSN